MGRVRVRNQAVCAVQGEGPCCSLASSSVSPPCAFSGAVWFQGVLDRRSEAQEVWCCPTLSWPIVQRRK